MTSSPVNVPETSFPAFTTTQFVHSMFSGEPKMLSSKPQKSKPKSAVMPPLTTFDRIDSLLQHELERFRSTKAEITEEEVEHWHRYLEPYPLQAIEWAFDSYRRNGTFFPVYGNIIDLCKAWRPTEAQAGLCEPSCRARHGRGYHANDMIWLFKNYDFPDRPLTDQEISGMLDQLDKQRGRAPEWRT